MARPKENDFKRSTKDKLAQTVAYRCSRPDCRTPTIGPKENTSDTDSIGRAAHICAASAGGPRHDSSMTAIEISSFENGIWLCANHASEIDSDFSNYSKEALLDWKKQALKLAKIEKGNKLPNKNDAVETLMVAMGSLKKSIPSMIQNIHKASSQTLEQLDPRFSVKSSFFNEIEHFEILAKENVSIGFTMNPKNPYEFSQNYSKWASHGDDLYIDTSEVNVEGSQLFKEIFSLKGKLTVGAPQKSALIKILTVTLNDKEEYFDSFQGKVSIGKEGFKFKGFTDLNLLEINFSANFEDSAGQFNLTLRLDRWNAIDVTKLPYFDKINKFFDSLSKGNEFFVELEIEGNRIFSTKKTSVKDNDYFKYISCNLIYTKAARVFAHHTNQLINFKSNYTFTTEQYFDMLDIQRIAEGKAVVKKNDLKSKITCEVCFDKQEAVDAVQKDLAQKTIKFTETNHLSLFIFDQEIRRPPKVHVLHPVTLKIKNKKVQLGQLMKVEVVPLDDFEMTTHFELTNS